MDLFPSFSLAEEDSSSAKLNQIKSEPLFTTTEYQISAIVDKIKDIDNLDEKAMKDIILRQHSMIFNYDLFLKSRKDRYFAYTLFTNKKFLKLFLDVAGLIDFSQHERICINKLTYDYYISTNKDEEISNLLYLISTVVNGTQVLLLSSDLGLDNARLLSMIRNSTFKDEKAVHRVNTFLIKCNMMLSAQNMINIFCNLFSRFTTPFIYTMLETRPSNLDENQYKKFDNISIAMLEILNSVTSSDIYKVLSDYAMTLRMFPNVKVRFPLKSVKSYPRITAQIKNVEIGSNGDLIIP